MTDLKIAVNGAHDDAFITDLVRGLCAAPYFSSAHAPSFNGTPVPSFNGTHVPSFSGAHVALVGAQVDLSLLEQINAELNGGLTFSQTLDRLEAFSGADMVIQAAQPPRQAWQNLQRQIEERHGYPGGGLLAGFSGAAYALDVARDIERVCPSAWLIQLSGPLMETGTLLSRETSLRVIAPGVADATAQAAARVLELDPASVDSVTAGFPGWTWLVEFRCSSEDAYPEFDEWARRRSGRYFRTAGPSTELTRAAVHQFRLFGNLPVNLTPVTFLWWYLAGPETAEHWFGPAGDAGLEAEQISPSGSRTAQLVCALAGSGSVEMQACIPNRGTVLPGFPEDLFIEVPAQIDETGASPQPIQPLPALLVNGALVPRWQRAELMVQALHSHMRDDLLSYLLADHRTRSIEQAQELLDDWFAEPYNASMGQFFLGRRNDHPTYLE